MSDQPSKQNPTDQPKAKPEVKSDTFSQVSDADADNVKGGMGMSRGEKPTLNPTNSDGCCN